MELMDAHEESCWTTIFVIPGNSITWRYLFSLGGDVDICRSNLSVCGDCMAGDAPMGRVFGQGDGDGGFAIVVGMQVGQPYGRIGDILV